MNGSRELGQDDKYVIIASDGVFEFLTNQMVADLIAAHSDPLEACKAVVAQAYEMWLQYEVAHCAIFFLIRFSDFFITIYYY